jgi:putative oxygen-independent coproporphyrinogen III oxidase
MAQQPDGAPAPTDGLLPAETVFSADSTFHAYVHVPFCRVRCGYCDFNTYTATELRGVSQDGFAQQLIAEIEFSRDVLKASGAPSRKLSTVFFGGGTPTQLPVADLVAILDSLRQAFGIAPDAEVTTEANPDNVDLDYLAALRAGGFTRVSFGMQSAVPSVLATLDRTHQPEKVPQVVAWAKQAGLQTSVDLIYGTPGETLEQWEASIDAALAMETDHISAYSLIVEDGTKMARLISSGQLDEQDDDLQASKYELADARFAAAGFDWYELSNWARGENSQSRHNLSYWQGMDWWGYGPGAHSHIAGTRWWNRKHPAPYTQALAKGESPAVGREILSSQARLEEAVLLQIRLRSGLATSTLREIEAFEPKVIASLIADELVEAKAAIQGRLVLTLKGRLLADAVVRALIA